MLLLPAHVRIDPITDGECLNRGVTLDVLRLDQIHPVVSGNKLFKLKRFMDAAVEQQAEGLLTFGGAYSNHLVATAFLCREYGMKSVGIVRGERSEPISPTLRHCTEYGMELRFISRDEFSELNAERLMQYSGQYPRMQLVPEGGYHPLGAAGASSICRLIPKPITHIACATGTCTMLAGLYLGRRAHQQLIAVPVLKGINDIFSRLEYLSGRKPDARLIHIADGYHFGGYARHNEILIGFMNELYAGHQLPTDKVYTAKLLFAVKDLITHNHFPEGSRILVVHSGGLQGNASLQPGTLRF